jgi:hypothetical protein
MKLRAPPYSAVTASFEKEASVTFDDAEKSAFLVMWPHAWPAYRQVLEELFASYDYDNLLKKKKTRVAIEKLIPKKANERANLLLRFSFDDSGITWDIFQRDRAIVHAQPAF